MPGDLPAPRLGVRPAQRPRPVAAGVPAGRDLSRHASRTASSRWRSSKADAADPLLGDDRPALQRLPRRRVGPPRHGRARHLRTALPRGLPVGSLVADDPAQARELPCRVRGLRPRSGGRVREARRRAAARRRLDRAAPRQDRGGDRQCRGDRGAAGLGARCTSSSGRTGLPGTGRRAPRPTGRPRRPSRPRSPRPCGKPGFRFVGPTTVYAAMQACGVVNDHIAGCWVRKAAEGRHPS